MAQFNADPEIQAALQAYRVQDAELEALSQGYTPEKARGLKNRSFDRSALGQRGPGLEHLDQLTVEVLLGVRGSAPLRTPRAQTEVGA